MTIDCSKLKAFADDKLNVNVYLNFNLKMEENIVGKGKKMLVTSIFSFSHNVFKAFSVRFVKSWDCL